MRFRLLIFLLTLIALGGCQKESSNPAPATNESQGFTSVVQAEDGTQYAIACLRESAAAIAKSGPSAMASCKVNTKAASKEERGLWLSSYTSAYVYYPYTYIDPVSYAYAYNYSNSPYYYYYPNYSYTSPSTQAFCGFVFGGNYQNNCGYNLYALFGYGNGSYNSNYNSACYACLNYTAPGACSATCTTLYYY